MNDMSGAKQSRFTYYLIFLGYNLYRNFLMTIRLMIFGCHINNIGQLCMSRKTHKTVFSLWDSKVDIDNEILKEHTYCKAQHIDNFI